LIGLIIFEVKVEVEEIEKTRLNRLRRQD